MCALICYTNPKPGKANAWCGESERLLVSQDSTHAGHSVMRELEMGREEGGSLDINTHTHRDTHIHTHTHTLTHTGGMYIHTGGMHIHTQVACAYTHR